MDSPFNISTSSLGSLKDTSLVQNKMTKLQRAKRLRRQTGTLDISYATDYPDQLKKTTVHLGSGVCEDPELDNWSESISDPVSSLESIDRLSQLSEIEREADQDTTLSFSKIESEISFSRQISALTETFIDDGNNNNNNSILLSESSDYLNKENMDSVTVPEIDLNQDVVVTRDRTDLVDTEDVEGDVKEDLESVSMSGGERYVASAPVTPFGCVEKKKNKNISPALSLLEKSTSWITSLSSGPKKVKKSLNLKSAKKSLTSLFEAVASSASLGSHITDVSSHPTNIHHSQTLPNQPARPPADVLGTKRSDDLTMSEENRSGSTLSLTELNCRPSPDQSQRLSRKSNRLSPVANPSGYHTIDSHRLPTSKHSRTSLEDKKLLQCVKQFNIDPKRGIELLEHQGFLDSGNPECVANFLFTEARLSKKQIGAYIGAHHDFNKLVLHSFVSHHKFMDLILVQALRQFLWSFRLPGEAMQIDRIMESFAAHYCNQNPGLFDETDTCYILSFSIIMLNTALHNPNVRQKITLEQFVSQNRGINSGKDLQKEVLEKIYRSIKEEPFEIPNESYDDLMYTFFSPEKEGWLFKEGGNWKNWKRRWFVLSDRCLYYFQHTAENVPKGIIPLENVKVRLVEDNTRKFCFEVYSESNSVVKGCKTDSNGTVVQGHHKSYRMSASTDEERLAWVKTISESIKDHPFYDLINSKKAALRRKSLKHIQQHDLPLPSTPQPSALNTTGEITTLSYTLQT